MRPLRPAENSHALNHAAEAHENAAPPADGARVSRGLVAPALLEVSYPGAESNSRRLVVYRGENNETGGYEEESLHLGPDLENGIGRTRANADFCPASVL
jgi:hypothetical protein